MVVRLGMDLQEGESFRPFMSPDQIVGVEAMVRGDLVAFWGFS